MFEKEAEDFVMRECCSTCYIKKLCSCKEKCERWMLVKKGVLFGYSKAKANEWHKYSERPNEKINALCFDTSQNKFILGFYDLEADEWLRYGGYETIHIDLWKKIEVPEEDKNDNR